MNFEYNLIDSNGSLLIQINQNELIIGDYELLHLLLTEDIRDNEVTLEWIDNVLQGKMLKCDCGGDIISAVCTKGKTKLTYEEQVSPNNSAVCELPTWLFKEIVEVWLLKIKEHFQAGTMR